MFQFRPEWGGSLFGLVIGLCLVSPPGLASGQAAETREFRIVASQYEFEPDRIEVNRGDRVRLVLESSDVLHGFAIPDLGVSVRIPEGGSTVTVEFVVNESGEFRFGCSEYCGAGHADMQGALVVRSAEGTLDVAASRRLPAAGEADYTVINLPTTLQMAQGRFAFRVTHRFARPLGDGSIGDLFEDFFGLDGGAQIGLEVRYGLLAKTQVGIYRVSDRTIQLFGRQGLLAQDAGAPIGLDLNFSVEGQDNFKREYSPNVGVVLSRRLGPRVALYAAPSFVGNTNLLTTGDDEDQHTVVLGLGARVLITDTVAFVTDVTPRLGGFDGRPGNRSNEIHATFGVEKLLRGHVFQMNFSNELGSTPASIARGQQGPDDWFLGFNISRRF